MLLGPDPLGHFMPLAGNPLLTEYAGKRGCKTVWEKRGKWIKIDEMDPLEHFMPLAGNPRLTEYACPTQNMKGKE